MNQSLVDILHVAGQAIRIPCNIVLIVLMIVSVVQMGHVFVESWFEIKHGKLNSIALARNLCNKGKEEKLQLIENSLLNGREKVMLKEMIKSDDMSEDMRQAIAERLLEAQEARYKRILHITELVAKLGPMFGLLGTLIPLGPGIVALGTGDVQTLSNSMEMAFDTTIAGVISAAVCSVLTGIRKRWYNRNVQNIQLIMESLL